MEIRAQYRPSQAKKADIIDNIDIELEIIEPVREKSNVTDCEIREICRNKTARRNVTMHQEDEKSLTLPARANVEFVCVIEYAGILNDA